VEKGRAVTTNSFALLGATEEDKHFEDEPVEVSAEKVLVKEFEEE
jgi:hypothetical protein